MKPAFLALALCTLGCTRSSEPAPEPSRAGALHPAAVFSYGTIDGTEFSSATTRGRVTVLLFVTTFDVGSQLMARRLEDAKHHHTPRVNAAAVVLEAPDHADLARVYRDTIGLTYDVAMSDATPAEPGPFGVIDAVPTLIILDTAGRERFRHTGVLGGADLERALGLAQRG